jgi:branched-chain amino acid transport system substrate-binding protein
MKKIILTLILVLVTQLLQPLPTSLGAPNTVQLSFQGPITGALGNYGVLQALSMRFVINKFNLEQHNIRVDYDFIDDQGDINFSNGGGQDFGWLIRNAISNPNLIGVVGPANSGTARASFPFYSAAKLPLISTAANYPTLADPSFGGNGIFHRVLPLSIGGNNVNTESIGTALGGLAMGLNKKRDRNSIMVIFYNDGYYSNKIANDVITSLEKNRTPFSLLELSNQNYSIISQGIVKVAPSVIAYVGSEQSGYPDGGAGKLLKALKNSGYGGNFVTVDLDDVNYGDWKNAFLSEAGSDIASNSLVISNCFDLRALNQKLSQEFEQSLGISPSCLSVNTINATNIFLQGITAGNTTRENLAKFVNSYRGFGLAGNPIAFTTQGDLIKPIWGLEKFAGSEWEYIGSTYSTIQKPYIPSISGYRKTRKGFSFRISNFNSLYAWSVFTASSGEISIDNRGIATFIAQDPLAKINPVVTVTSNRAGYFSGKTTIALR